jgi:hypothetical protein
VPFVVVQQLRRGGEERPQVEPAAGGTEPFRQLRPAGQRGLVAEPLTEQPAAVLQQPPQLRIAVRVRCGGEGLGVVAGRDVQQREQPARLGLVRQREIRAGRSATKRASSAISAIGVPPSLRSARLFPIDAAEPTGVCRRSPPPGTG